MEREDRNERRRAGTLTHDEKLEQEMLEEMEKERLDLFATVDLLIHGDIRDINNK